MDNLFEYIIPIVFAAIYLFGNKLSKTAEDVFDQTREETDTDERQRRIQEEIRRKIAERKNEVSQTKRHQTLQPTCSSESTDIESTDTESKVSEPLVEPEAFTSPVDTFASQLQAQLERVEATKRQAEELKKQGAIVPFNSQSGSISRTADLFSGSVRSSLRDTAAARAAFIYGEVLGTPVSQKKVSTVPGLC